VYTEHLNQPPASKAPTGLWLKLGDAAHALGVSEITLRRKVKCNKLAHDFRHGKYYVYLYKDDATGHFYEPGQLEQPYRGASGGPQFSGGGLQGAGVETDVLMRTVPSHVSHARSGTLPVISLRDARSPHAPNMEQRELQEQRGHQEHRDLLERVRTLAADVESKEIHIQSLRRSLEDQATLIAFLEDTIEKLARPERTHTSPAVHTR